MALEKIAELYTPYHKIVGDFYDSVYGNLPGFGGYSMKGLLAPTNTPYNPDKNMVDMMA